MALALTRSIEVVVSIRDVIVSVIFLSMISPFAQPQPVGLCPDTPRPLRPKGVAR
jgi:hypothetical protein